MPAAYAGTDIISCLRSKYIMRQRRISYRHRRYIIYTRVRIHTQKRQKYLFYSPCAKTLTKINLFRKILQVYLQSLFAKIDFCATIHAKGSRENGAGRWSVIQVPTLSFYEYCELLGVERPAIPEDLKVTSLLCKSQIERNRIMLQLSEVQNHFMRYLQVGGFPELALADNDLMAQQVMREDVVDKVLKRGLPSLYNIRNATESERIFLYLCNVSSEIVSMEWNN